MLAQSLVGFTETNEQFKKQCITIILHYATLNPEMCGWCGGIRLVVDSITDPSIHENENIIHTLLFLLNEPENRENVRGTLDLSRLFSIFTDIDMKDDLQHKSKENRVDLNKFKE